MPAIYIYFYRGGHHRLVFAVSIRDYFPCVDLQTFFNGSLSLSMMSIPNKCIMNYADLWEGLFLRFIVGVRIFLALGSIVI